LASEWKIRVVRYIQAAHRQEPFVCRRLKSDRRRRLSIPKRLGFVAPMKWRVRSGPALDDPRNAWAYCGRYSRRPALGEARILAYDGRSVTFLYKDY
jgi:hypothetical protein